MSKVKLAELEESALVVSEKFLVEIETRLDNLGKGDERGKIKDLKLLVDCYNTLKPYF